MLLLLLAPAPSSAAGQPAPRSIRGIHTLAASREAIDAQLTWAHSLVGAGGHVTQPYLGIGPDTEGPSTDAVYYVEQAYARELDPILVLQGRYLNRDGCNATGYVGWLRPTPDADGASYLEEAAGYRRFVEGLPRVEGRTLYLQVGNEPNLDEMWGGAASPAEYARFFVDVSAAIRAIGDPRIRVLNAALAPEGNVDNLAFIKQASAADSRFRSSFDLWASHPYPRNQPPAQNLHDATALPGSRYTIDAYLLELEALADAGVDIAGLQVVLTETGYELEDAHYAEYPAVTEELRAEYVRQALEEHWPHWPEVRAVTPFELSGWYGSWQRFDWVYPSSTTSRHGLPTQPRLQYTRLMPGMGTLNGTILDDAGAPLKGVTVLAEPGQHEALTLADGSFLLLAPPGTYTLAASRPGYEDAIRPGVHVAAGDSESVGLVLAARLPTALVNPSFEADDLANWTAWGDADGVQTSPWFFDIGAQEGNGFLGTAVNCGAKDGGVQQSIAAQPGGTATVHAWTLTRREGDAPIRNRIGVDPRGGTDRTSERVVWSDWIETGGAWQQVGVEAWAESDRVTIFLEHDQDAANAWNLSAFDEVTVEWRP